MKDILQECLKNPWKYIVYSSMAIYTGIQVFTFFKENKISIQPNPDSKAF